MSAEPLLRAVPKPAVSYCRVSSAGQANEGVSMDAQLARAHAWAEVNGYAIHESFSDPGLSGKRADNRPGLQAALDAVCAAQGALVVYSLSRLARSVPDAMAIVKRLDGAGADLVSLTESIDTTTATGRLIFVVFAAFAAFERELTGERTRSALAHLKATGRAYGQAPYGKRAQDGALVDEPEDARTLDLITALRLTRTWPQVAAELNLQAVTSKKGRAWTSANVRRVALRRVIAT